MIKEKIQQAVDILKEENADCWLTFARESSVNPDPVMDLLVGANVTWQSAFILTAKGDSIAIVGSLDRATQESNGYYQVVTGYVDSIEDALLSTLKKINPDRILLNYSLNSPMADGLSHGMFLQLEKYLKAAGMTSRIESSERVIGKLRGRKSRTETEYVGRAVDLTIEMFQAVTEFIRPGITEKDIAGFLREQVKKHEVELAWDPDHCPAVFTGPDTAGAHAAPTGREVQPGHVLNIDFGIRLNGYCSDLQRSWYIRRPGESDVPGPVQKGFQVIFDSITAAAQAIKPGMKGYEIDRIARSLITENGYDEYPHALGHQIGRTAHDGGGLLAPHWERYGTLPDQPIEEFQLYTIEPRLNIDGYGIATIEEIIQVTAPGALFLSPRQEEIYVI